MGGRGKKLKEAIVMELRELEDRIRVLEDIEAIKRLQREYLYMLTDARYEGLAPLFTEDAIVQIGEERVAKGKDAIVKLFRDDTVMTGGRKGGHNLIRPVISIEGDKARGRWTMFRFYYDNSEPAGPRLKWQEGKYECEYVKKASRWQVSYLKYTVPWPVQTRTAR
jgi:ketosteroid isomerase-like protein